MIVRIMARGIKGIEFDQPLQRLNLFVGPNGVGKSARADALILAILGYLPGVAKRNQDILSRYGSGTKLFVGCELDDHTHLLRRYSKNEKGEVNQEIMVNRRTAKKEEYAVALAGHQIFDLPAFLELSDNKKIDWLLGLFPQAQELVVLDEELQKKTKALNSKAADMRALEVAIQRLTAARAGIDLPAGTLAEVSAQIQMLEKQLEQANGQLLEVRLETAKNEGQTQAKVDYEALREKDLKVREEQFAKMREEAKRAQGIPPKRPGPAPDPGEAIRKILATMQEAGCGACVAGMVAKRELKRMEAGHGSAAA